MKINPRGYWENPTAEGHGHDEGLAKALVNFFDKEDKLVEVIDVGCGDGFYTNYLAESEKKITCVGIDGNPNTGTLAGFRCHTEDLSKPLKIKRVFDWVLCLEVGEHIPAEYEEIFLNNLDRLNRCGMVLSWSIPEYGGDGHVNPKPNEYIIDKVTSMGYSYDEESTAILRTAPAKYPIPCYWFSKTLMVFSKNEKCSQGYDYSLGD